MTETPPRYRTLDRPGPGLALIAEPDGRQELWSLNQRGARLRLCAQCGTMTAQMYHPALVRGPHRPHLCRPCVEGTPAPA